MSDLAKIVDSSVNLCDDLLNVQKDEDIINCPKGVSKRLCEYLQTRKPSHVGKRRTKSSRSSKSMRTRNERYRCSYTLLAESNKINYVAKPGAHKSSY